MIRIIGLFQPEHTDPFTGYRYYQAAQLPDLNRILAMKELGLSLDQIKRLVAEDVSAEEIRGMLSLKKAQVEQDIHTELERLHQIEARLSQVEQEGAMSADDVVLKELHEQPIFSFREVLPSLPSAGLFIRELKNLLPSHIPHKNLGHLTAIFHSEALLDENADVKLGFQLSDEVNKPLYLSGGQEVKTRILSYVETAACVVRVGGFENGFDSYGNVGRWIETNGYQLSGLVREVYLVPPNPERIEETVCEIQVPVTLQLQTSLPSTTSGT